ncbi:tetratricopeptide repeat protein [Streptomyces sp. F001]|uniref:tetratricopeptide repeat protein n=1 Tax=Streptomyces sp. F001 TaxID=1510026 RepID=UPI0013EEE152|nr:tetratricopeptide repeat protein [Streptomyces sp. F001]
MTYRLLGRVEEARQRDEEALRSLTERLGESHPIALACAINLASDLSALGRADEARELGEKARALCLARLGEDHPTTLVGGANLALDLIAVGRETEGGAARGCPGPPGARPGRTPAALRRLRSSPGDAPGTGPGAGQLRHRPDAAVR